MSRRSALPLLLTLLVLVAGEAAAQQAVPGPLRPHDAPLPGGELPPLPPEYLSHQQAGIRFDYHPSAREPVKSLIDSAAALREELSQQLGLPVLETLSVRVAFSTTDFQRVSPRGAPLGSRGLALREHRLLILSSSEELQGQPADLGCAFRHGLAHLAIDEAVGKQPVPLWLHEGFALHFSEQTRLSRQRALWWAAMKQRMIPLGELDGQLAERSDSSSVAAAEAADFVRFLSAGERAGAFVRLLEELRSKASLRPAVQTAYQADIHGLEQSWREDVARYKAFVPVLIGGTCLWVLIVLGVRLHRSWQKRWRRAAPVQLELASQVHEPAAEEPDYIEVLQIAKPGTMPGPEPESEPEPPEPPLEPEDPEVPKISHNGRWHTLH